MREMVARSQCPGSLSDTRIMLLFLAGCLALAAAAPATYDMRQEGEENYHADIKNIVVLVAIPQELPIPLDVLNGLVKFRSNGREESRDKADVQLTGAFVKPSTPYKVEIEEDRSVTGDAGIVEVVIAGRRRSDVGHPERDEIKPLERSENQPEKTPKVNPSS